MTCKLCREDDLSSVKSVSLSFSFRPSSEKDFADALKITSSLLTLCLVNRRLSCHLVSGPGHGGPGRRSLQLLEAPGLSQRNVDPEDLKTTYERDQVDVQSDGKSCRICKFSPMLPMEWLHC